MEKNRVIPEIHIISIEENKIYDGDDDKLDDDDNCERDYLNVYPKQKEAKGSNRHQDYDDDYADYYYEEDNFEHRLEFAVFVCFIKRRDASRRLFASMAKYLEV